MEIWGPLIFGGPEQPHRLHWPLYGLAEMVFPAFLINEREYKSLTIFME
jgi:hypothetical protein